MNRRVYPLFLVVNIIVTLLFNGMETMSIIRIVLTTVLFIIFNEILRLFSERPKK
ncbi:MAG: hypothetical protein ACRC6X_04515 [Culicoidibacterales bacterium]